VSVVQQRSHLPVIVDPSHGTGSRSLVYPMTLAAVAAGADGVMIDVHATPEGWQSAMHLFDYNLDRLGLGAVDAPGWKIADRTKAYATRAVAARAGLWGNHGYEADYAVIWTDADGECDHGLATWATLLEVQAREDDAARSGARRGSSASR